MVTILSEAGIFAVDGSGGRRPMAEQQVVACRRGSAGCGGEWRLLCEQMARETVLLCSGGPWRALAALLTAREYVMAAACFVCVCSRSPAWCERVHVPVLGSCTVCTGRPVPYVFCVCRCAMKNYFDPTGPFH